MQGLFGKGHLAAGGRDTANTPTGDPVSIQISLGHNKAGVGVYFKPTTKFFNKDGKRVRPIPYRLVSDDYNIALIDEDLLLVGTCSDGETTIFAETLDKKLTSNKSEQTNGD